jgi:4-hydroxy-2-oxoheptanedioate aldolase
MTGTTVTMNGSANGHAKKGGIAKAKKFDFKPVNHAEFAEKGMAIYRAPSLLQPHRVCF